MIVLDTNVLSELMRPSPAPQVRIWVDQHPAGDLWITAMTAAELLVGVAALPEGGRKRQLGNQVGTLLDDVFSGRTLPFDEAAAVEYARVVTARRRAGTPIGMADAVIAATCLAGGALRLATRNVADFAGIGLRIEDPWSASVG